MTKSKDGPLCAEWAALLESTTDEERSAFEDWMRWGTLSRDKCLLAMARAWGFVRDDDGEFRRLH